MLTKPGGEDDVGRFRFDQRNRIADRAHWIRELRIDGHQDAALRLRGATAKHSPVTFPVARIEHAHIEVESGRLEILLDRLERRGQLGYIPRQRNQDRHAGRAHAGILIFTKDPRTLAESRSTMRKYSASPR